MYLFLKDIVNIISGGTPKTSVPNYWNGSIPWISIKDFNTDNIYIDTTEKSITKLGLENSSTNLLLENDIIISARGTVGCLGIIKEEMAFNQSCYGLRVKNTNQVNSKYLFWFLKNTMNLLKSKTHGSVFDTIIKSDLENFQVFLPNLKIQNRIAKILDDITKKIIINNKINKNLHEIAKCKYDVFNKNSYNWNLIKINELNIEVTDYVANGSFKSLADNVTLYDEKEYALYVRNTDLKVNFTDKRKYVDKKSYDFLKKSKLTGGELIISNVGDVGSVFICPYLDMPMTLGSNVIMLYSTDKHYYNYFLYFFFTSIYGQYMINGITGGSAQPKFNKTDFRKMEIQFPTFTELDNFNREIEPIYKKYELNIKENRNLSQLRDTLLPRLMNGEIDLENINI